MRRKSTEIGSCTTIRPGTVFKSNLNTFPLTRLPGKVAGHLFIAMIILGFASCQSKELSENLGKKTIATFDSLVSSYSNQNDTLGILASKFIFRNIINKYSINKSDGSRLYDTTSVNFVYLKKSIDHSLARSRTDIIEGKLDLNTFLEYILPYRLANEPLSEWWHDSSKMFAEIPEKETSFNNRNDYRIFAATEINRHLTGTFVFNNSLTNADEKSWAELISNRSGDCRAMANTIIYPLRAIGVPVTEDFCTSWANVNGGGHTWNVLLSDGKTIPFLGFESSPNAYTPFGIYNKLQRIPAKIFRRTYSINPGLLHHTKAAKQSVPRSLDFENAIDVTKLYLPTRNIQMSVKGRYRPSTAYLSVFSNSQIVPVFWAKGENGCYSFPDMADGILYLPTDWRGGAGVPFYHPFSLKKGRIHLFKPDKKNRISLRITSVGSKEQHAMAQYGEKLEYEAFVARLDSIERGDTVYAPDDSTLYRLSYWDSGWVPLGTEYKSVGGEIKFDNVPANTVYKLDAPEKKNVTRVFSYENGRQIFW